METTFRSSQIIAFHRLAGAAFMMGNVLFLLNKLNEMSRLFLGRWMPDVISGQNPLLIAAGQVALIIGYVGFLLVYTPRVGRWGKHALRMFSWGGMILAVGHAGFMSVLGELVPASIAPYVESFFLLVIFGVLLLTVGLIWFGIQNLRQPVLVRWQWLPLATGLMGFIGFFFASGAEITATFLFFRTLFALGLIGLGLMMWLEKQSPSVIVREPWSSDQGINSPPGRLQKPQEEG